MSILVKTHGFVASLWIPIHMRVHFAPSYLVIDIKEPVQEITARSALQKLQRDECACLGDVDILSSWVLLIVISFGVFVRGLTDRSSCDGLPSYPNRANPSEAAFTVLGALGASISKRYS